MLVLQRNHFLVISCFYVFWFRAVLVTHVVWHFTSLRAYRFTIEGENYKLFVYWDNVLFLRIFWWLLCVWGTYSCADVASAINSSWPHAFARIIARERRTSHGPKSRVCWSPGEPARVQPPFPQDIWILSSSVIRLALIGAVVLARIWSISNHEHGWLNSHTVVCLPQFAEKTINLQTTKC